MRRLVLEGELGLRDAPDLAQTLAAALADGGAVMDVAGLQSADSAILQVLIAGHRSAVESNAPFGFLDPEQPALRSALVSHGMVGGDGSPLTAEHDFWTRAITPAEGVTA